MKGGGGALGPSRRTGTIFKPVFPLAESGTGKRAGTNITLPHKHALSPLFCPCLTLSLGCRGWRGRAMVVPKDYHSSLSLSLSLFLTHTRTLYLSPSPSPSPSLSLSLAHTLSRTHTRTLTHSHTLPLSRLQRVAREGAAAVSIENVDKKKPHIEMDIAMGLSVNPTPQIAAEQKGNNL